eukprot:2137302-Prymnesium_polylepis.1
MRSLPALYLAGRCRSHVRLSCPGCLRGVWPYRDGCRRAYLLVTEPETRRCGWLSSNPGSIHAPPLLFHNSFPQVPARRTVAAPPPDSSLEISCLTVLVRCGICRQRHRHAPQWIFDVGIWFAVCALVAGRGGMLHRWSTQSTRGVYARDWRGSNPCVWQIGLCEGQSVCLCLAASGYACCVARCHCYLQCRLFCCRYLQRMLPWLLHVCVSAHGVVGIAIACDQTPRQDSRLSTCVGPCLGPGYARADCTVCRFRCHRLWASLRNYRPLVRNLGLLRSERCAADVCGNPGYGPLA